MSDLDIEHICMTTGAKPRHEFEDIFILPAEDTRPAMSVPPTPTASKTFIDQVRHELDLPVDVATRVADWAAGKMERYSAMDARPVFDMDGSGPNCSTCGCIWPICGHHHWSNFEPEPDDEIGNTR